jgi:hypothetical protein
VPVAPDTCIVAGRLGPPPDSVAVVVGALPNAASLPASGAEWFVAAHTTEPLVRVDCAGVSRPGLAASWERLAGGRVWTFTLRSDAELPDGAPASADAIVTDWRRPAAAARLALAEVIDTRADRDRVLRVTFAAATDSAPMRLAHPVLAPGLETPERRRSREAPQLRLIRAEGDLRDAVDAGLDFIVTSDQPTLEYARSRAGLVTVPLPWARTYVLAAPEPLAAARDERFRGSLARDVVPDDARAAAPPVWWDVGCASAAASRQGSRATSDRVVYPAADATAGAIAGRLVAIGAAGPRGTVQPVPLDELMSRLGRGEAVTAVLPIARFDPAPCSVRSLSLAGWFVAPLVDTREHLIARRDGPAVEVDGFGALRILSADSAR